MTINGNLNVFVISTGLHLFQVSLISKELTKNIFVISDEIADLYDFPLLLNGRCVFVSFQDDYINVLKSVVWGKKRAVKINLYLCNQNHAISSYLLNAYEVTQLVLLDDGLVSYGLQAEKEKWLHNALKKIVNALLSLFGVYVLSYGHGNNLKLPRGLKATFVSIINEYKSPYRYLKVVPLLQFIDYKLSMSFIDKIITMSGEIKYTSYSFLSYQQTIDEDEAGEVGCSNQKLVRHPRASAEKRPLIPYEFLIKDATQLYCGVTSIYLVSKFFYGITPLIICKDEDRALSEAMEVLN